MKEHLWMAELNISRFPLELQLEAYRDPDTVRRQIEEYDATVAQFYRDANTEGAPIARGPATQLGDIAVSSALRSTASAGEWA